MNETFAKNFAERRKELGFTQAEIASKLNVSPQAVSKWENGESLPDVALLPLIAEQLETTIDALFGREKKEKVEIIDSPKGDYSSYFLRIEAVSSDGGKAKINIPLSVAEIMFRSKGEIKIAGFELSKEDFHNIIDMVEGGALGYLVDAESPDGDHAKIYVEKMK